MTPQKMDAAEWVGHNIQNWPVWIVIPAIMAIVVVAFFLYIGDVNMFGSKTHEWPEDKKKRLAKEAAKKQSKMNAKQSKLKLKKG